MTSKQVNEGYRFEVQAYLDELSADLVCVELYAEPREGEQPFRLSLQRGAMLSGTANAYVYQGLAPADRPVTDYTPRIVPTHEDVNVPLEANFILWYR